MRLRNMAMAAAALTFIMSAAGCEQVKEFSEDSIQSLGSQVSDTVDALSSTLGISDEEGPTPEPVHTDRVYEMAGPKPTMTMDEKALEQKKREEILKGVNGYFEGRSEAVPEEGTGEDTAGAAAGEMSDGGKEDKKGRKENSATEPSPTPAQEPSVTAGPTPTPEPSPSPTPTPMPVPTEKPEPTPTPVPDDALLDW